MAHLKRLVFYLSGLGPNNVLQMKTAIVTTQKKYVKDMTYQPLVLSQIINREKQKEEFNCKIFHMESLNLSCIFIQHVQVLFIQEFTMQTDYK